MRIGTKSPLNCVVVQAGWSPVYSPLELWFFTTLSLGCDLGLTPHQAHLSPSFTGSCFLDNKLEFFGIK